MSRILRKGVQGGYTLIEVMVTTAILLAVLAILAPLLTGALTTFGRQSDRSGALDGAGLVLQQMERDVLASSVLSVGALSAGGAYGVVLPVTLPAVPTPGNDLRLITGKFASTSCVEYLVPASADPQPSSLLLERRVRIAGSGFSWPAVGGGWQTLLTSLKVAGYPAGSVIPNPAGAKPFTPPPIVSGAPSASLSSVNIDIRVLNGSSPADELTTTATGRTAIATTPAAAAAAWTAQCS